MDDIVNRFALKKERRMTLMNILEMDDASISKHLSMDEDDCLDLQWWLPVSITEKKNCYRSSKGYISH